MRPRPKDGLLTRESGRKGNTNKIPARAIELTARGHIVRCYWHGPRWSRVRAGDRQGRVARQRQGRRPNAPSHAGSSSTIRDEREA